MSNPPKNRSPIIAVLRQHGPMTAHEIAEHLDWPPSKVVRTIASTRWLLPGKVFRVVRYVPVIGKRARDQAVYAARRGPDAPRTADPVERRRQAQARHRTAHRARINARSLARHVGRERPAASNPWMQLAHPSLRSHMARTSGQVQP